MLFVKNKEQFKKYINLYGEIITDSQRIIERKESYESSITESDKEISKPKQKGS